MRNREEMKEYMQKHRFCKILERMKEQRVKCNFCDSVLETLHHKDENHANNRLNNLVPVCQQHHLEIPHLSDVALEDGFYELQPAKNTVTRPETIASILRNCNTGRVYNLTLRDPIRYNHRIRIQEGSIHLVEFLGSLGYTEIVKI